MNGVIYILTNPSFPEYVKIGYADDIDARLNQLNRSECIPFAFRVYATYEVSNRLVDLKLHNLIDQLNPTLRSIETFNGKQRKREFYAMSPEDAYELLEAIAIISGSQDKLAKSKKDSPVDVEGSAKKPAVNFLKCNIPIGAELVFIDDPSIKVTVVSERKVQYNNEITSLSAIAKSKRGYSVAGPSCFTYNGRLVADIARETQWKD